MTREEACKILNDYDINFERNTPEEVAEAHEMAIKALEAQPNEDCISRKAAINALWKALYEYEDKTENQFLKSKELDVADWFQHRIFVQNMSDIDRQTILNLPSVAPQPNERTEMHECDLEQIIKTTIKEYLDKECDDVTELLLTLSKDLCERIKHEDEKATAAQLKTECSRKENNPRLSKPAFTVIDHVLKEHEEHEDRFTTFCDGRHQQITTKQINAELDKLYNYFYGKGEESGEGTK